MLERTLIVLTMQVGTVNTFRGCFLSDLFIQIKLVWVNLSTTLKDLKACDMLRPKISIKFEMSLII